MADSNRRCTRVATSVGLTFRPSSREIDVTPASRMPHATIFEYASKELLQLSEKPCMVTPRLTRMPTRGDVDPHIQEIRENLIIEFVSR